MKDVSKGRGEGTARGTDEARCVCRRSGEMARLNPQRALYAATTRGAEKATAAQWLALVSPRYNAREIAPLV